MSTKPERDRDDDGGSTRGRYGSGNEDADGLPDRLKVGSDAYTCPFCAEHPRLETLAEWTDHLSSQHGVEGPL